MNLDFPDMNEIFLTEAQIGIDLKNDEPQRDPNVDDQEEEKHDPNPESVFATDVVFGVILLFMFFAPFFDRFCH